MIEETPKSVNDLVQFIASYVAVEFARTGRPVNGTRLAQAIRDRFPDMSYEQLGLSRLGDVVRIGQHEGLLRRRADVTHLEVLPGVGSSTAAEPPAESRESALRYVRPEVFKALMFFQRNSVRYLDRMTSRVIERDASDESLAMEGDGRRYVKLELIPAAVQQDWMREYLRSAALPNAADAPVDSARWWIDFPDWLRRNHPALEPGWRAYRVQSVISFVRDWAKQHDLPLSAVLVEKNPRSEFAPQSRSQFLPPPVKTDGGSIAAHQGAHLRTAILNAISEMSTEELAELSIPIRYLLRHFKVHR